MTKENQKILYDHYMELSKDGQTDKLRIEGKKRAEDILKSFPDFKKGAPAQPAAPVVPKEPEKPTASEPGGN